jgi:hypothetical protein
MRPCIRLLISLSLVPMSAPAASNIPPGKWEITTKVNVPQLPFGMTIPKNLPIPQSGTRSVCITQSSVDKPETLVKAQTGCALNDLKEREGLVDWRVTCPGQPPSRSTGTMAINGSTLQGTATVTTDLRGFQLPVHMSYTGRRLGDC